MTETDSLYSMLREHFPGLPIEQNASMKDYTSFRIGGPAELLAHPRTPEELAALWAFAHTEGIDAYIVGRGSNLLVHDAGIRGLVIVTTGAFAVETREDGAYVRADAGALIAKCAAAAAVSGHSGLEFAQGIPGTVGGAVFMNAGAYDGEMSGVVVKTDYCGTDGRILSVTGAEHAFGYRESVFTHHTERVILRSELRLRPACAEDVRLKTEDYAQRRKTRQPLEFPSAGSTFRRPPGQYAGTLIDKCGLKGTRIGGAEVSEKHAGFIINRGGATYDDVCRLIELIQDTVRQKTGVCLQCEVRRIGG